MNICFISKKIFWSWATSLQYIQFFMIFPIFCSKFTKFWGPLEPKVVDQLQNFFDFFEVQKHLLYHPKFGLHISNSLGDIPFSSCFPKNDTTFLFFNLGTFHEVIRPIFAEINKEKDMSWTIKNPKKQLFFIFFWKKTKKVFFSIIFFVITNCSNKVIIAYIL